MSAFGRQIDSVRIDKVHRGKTKVQPFFYSLINDDEVFDDGNIGATDDPRYFRLLANETKTIPVQLQDDSIFRLHYLEYNVGDANGNLGPNLGYTVPFPPVSSVPQTKYYVQSVDVELFAESSGARQLIEFGAGRIQFGNQGGMKYVRHPFLLPRSGQLSLKFKNRLPFDVYIDGFLFGYKVQI